MIEIYFSIQQQKIAQLAKLGPKLFVSNPKVSTDQGFGLGLKKLFSL